MDCMRDHEMEGEGRTEGKDEETNHGVPFFKEGHNAFAIELAEPQSLGHAGSL